MPEENQTRKAYLAAMQLDRHGDNAEEATTQAPEAQDNSTPPAGASRWQKALDRAHQNRALEIDLYWKRSAYYWAFQAAAFAAVGLVFKDGFPNDPFRQLLGLGFCGMGFLTALAGVLAAKGSKF